MFFKNLALGKTAEQLAAVEAEVREIILSYVANPEDCVRSRLLTPRDLQQTFGFPAATSNTPCWSTGNAMPTGIMRTTRTGASINSAHSKTYRFVATASPA